MRLLIKLPELPSARRRRLADGWHRLASLVPPTWMGSLVGVLSGLALWRWGYGKMDLLIFVFSLSGLALLGLGSLFTTGSALYLRRYLHRHPELLTTPLPVASTGSPTETGFALPSLGRIPLVKVSWRMVSPGNIRCRNRWREGMLVEEIVADRRCHVQDCVREIETRDAFGLSRLAWRFRQSGPLTILPHVGRLGTMPRVTSMASDEGLPHPSGAPEGDRMEIRRYVPGDPIRHILWKVYARTRQLNVRVPEKAIDRSQRIVAYLLTGDGDGAAAGAARMALQNELLGADWLFAADGFPEPTDDLEQSLLAIAGSGVRPAEVRPARVRPADGLRAFLARPEIADQTHCVVFAPAEPGPWVAEAMAAARTFSGVTSFILGTDGVSSGNRRGWWSRFLFRDEEVGGEAARGTEALDKGTPGNPSEVASFRRSRRPTTFEDLTALMATFHAAGNPVMVVDRTSGRTHGRIDAQSLAAGAVKPMADARTPLGRTG